MDKRTDIRIGLPSKGRLFEGSMEFLAKAGLSVYKPNPRQYEATIPALPGVVVLFNVSAILLSALKRAASTSASPVGIPTVNAHSAPADHCRSSGTSAMAAAHCRPSFRNQFGKSVLSLTWLSTAAIRAGRCGWPQNSPISPGNSWKTTTLQIRR